jgi:hypothetical protein
MIRASTPTTTGTTTLVHQPKAEQQGPVIVVVPEGTRPHGEADPALTPDTKVASRAIEDHITVEGGPEMKAYLTDLLEISSSGKDPTIGLMLLQRRVANDSAMQEALSNTLLAYHRMAMAVIGNMKA